jgi:hypothetical protein
VHIIKFDLRRMGWWWYGLGSSVKDRDQWESFHERGNEPSVKIKV